jgi:hypothetical protein
MMESYKKSPRCTCALLGTDECANCRMERVLNPKPISAEEEEFVRSLLGHVDRSALDTPKKPSNVVSVDFKARKKCTST